MSDILKGNDSALGEGSWVFTNQGVDAEFRNVSRHWMKETRSIEDAQADIEGKRKGRQDVMVKVSDITPTVHEGEDGARLEIRIGDGRNLILTDHAIGQLAMKIDVPTTFTNTYLAPKMHPTKKDVVKYERDAQDYQLVAMGLKNGLRRKAPDHKVLFRIYDENRCRAVLSDRYSIVDNIWYLDILKAVMPTARVSHWRGDADTIIGNVLIPDSLRAEDDSDYGGMISLSNCEIGTRAVAQIPSIFRAICMNGCIWGQTKGIEFRKRHKGIDLNDLGDRIKANINDQIPLLDSGIDLLLTTRSWQAQADMTALFTQMAYDARCSVKETVDIAETWYKESKEKTAFGVVDAITRYGQKASPRRWVELDSYAGSLVKGNAWATMNAKAKALTREDIEAAFTVTA